jgi:uncharacterized iron-regulated membrane protein
MNPSKVSRWRLPPSLVRVAMAGHSALGLTVSALLFLVALTGTVAMLIPELDRLQEWNAPVVEEVAPPLAARAVAGLPGETTRWRRITLEYPTEALPRLVLSAVPAKGEPQRFVADISGRLESRPEPWSGFLVELHERLSLPGMTGLIVVGLLGVAMLALTMGGLLAHPRLFRDAFLFRSKALERVRQADLHNRLSVWPLPFHVTIAFTGAALGLSLPIATLVGKVAWHQQPASVGTALLGPSAAAPAGIRTAVADLPAILNRIGNRPSRHIQRVILDRPGTAGQMVRVDVYRPGRLAYGDRLFFRGNGAPINPGGMLDVRPGLPFLNSLFALHFGTFGGTLLRIVYVLLGSALCVVIASGVRIWMARSRLGGRAMPWLEKIWRGWIWGSPLALLLSYGGASIGLPAMTSFLAVLAAILVFVVGKSFIPISAVADTGPQDHNR